MSKRGASEPDGGPTKHHKKATPDFNKKCIAYGTKSPEVGDTVWYGCREWNIGIGGTGRRDGAGGGPDWYFVIVRARFARTLEQIALGLSKNSSLDLRRV